MTGPDWRAEYEAERAARIDAEARLAGMRAWVALALVFGLAVCALAGCLQATNEASRSVARWRASAAVTR